LIPPRVTSTLLDTPYFNTDSIGIYIYIYIYIEREREREKGEEKEKKGSNCDIPSPIYG
jgi:hypothetical protein